MILSVESPKLCRKLIDFVLKRLVNLHRFVILNEEFVVQIQILNLYHTMLFNSPFKLKAESAKIRKTFGTLLSSKFFIDNLLLGLNSHYSYVR